MIENASVTAKQECRFNARGAASGAFLSLASIRTAETNQNALESVVRPITSQIAARKMPKPLCMEKSQKGLGVPLAIQKRGKEIINPLPPPPYGRGRGYFFPSLSGGAVEGKKYGKKELMYFFPSSKP